MSYLDLLVFEYCEIVFAKSSGRKNKGKNLLALPTSTNTVRNQCGLDMHSLIGVCVSVVIAIFPAEIQ